MTTRDVSHDGSRDSQVPCGQQFVQATRASWPIAHPPAAQFVRLWTRSARKLVLPACDAFALSLAVLLTAPVWPAVGYVLVALILLHVTGRHRLRICLRVSDEIPRLAAVAVLPIPLLLAWTKSGSELVLLGIASLGFLVTMRVGLYTILRIANRRGWSTEPALIVGTSELGLEIGELLQEHTELGLRPIGFIDSQAAAPESSLPLLGKPSEISDVVLQHDVRRIIVSPPADNDVALVTALRADPLFNADVCVVPRIHELTSAIPTSCLDEIWGIPLIPLRCSGLRMPTHKLKRSFDLVVGALLLIVLGPLLLLLMGAVLLSCGRPVFFRQTRVTRAGRPMKIIKLRTVAGTDREGNWTVPPDECSSLCRWLRATHLDELPQLLNVLRGEMSLVGPRPERPYFVSRFAEVVPRYEDRHRANTGMTGWAQVHGLTGDTSIPERVRFDNCYIERWSLWLDVVILARTLFTPLAGMRSKLPAGPRDEASQEHSSEAS
jgi:exopolysaccharide biosynthesis polyprenyl glycosylphosphotransferase